MDLNNPPEELETGRLVYHLQSALLTVRPIKKQPFLQTALLSSKPFVQTALLTSIPFLQTAL